MNSATYLLNASQCYDILGLQNEAPFKEVKQAYRKLSLKYHPDRNKDGTADSRFREITEAYQILKKEQKRENSRHRDVETAQAEFWKYYEKNTSEEFSYGHQASYKEFRRNFGATENYESHNAERPVSHKMTHLLLYGGLAAIALWIIISEILK
jgi:molecular chaperone DnaJ